MRTLPAVGLAAILTLVPAAWAQSVVTPKVQTPLRAAPPGGFFQGKGDQIDTALPSEKFRVLETRSVRTLTGTEQWLRVQQVENPSKIGWIYGGQDSQTAVTPAR
ncbi:MAG: hypothetical protein M5U07_27100 [Xanthobacteraceae bacterium]|nr:hypothetical protein [Xanthobacteraceae bacterium]PWB64083.1 MAG: hypothetical protein C3F17_07990 [Bradyrhizobiaceae bacterium]